MRPHLSPPGPLPPSHLCPQPAGPHSQVPPGTRGTPCACPAAPTVPQPPGSSVPGPHPLLSPHTVPAHSTCTLHLTRTHVQDSDSPGPAAGIRHPGVRCRDPGTQPRPQLPRAGLHGCWSPVVPPGPPLGTSRRFLAPSWGRVSYLPPHSPGPPPVPPGISTHELTEPLGGNPRFTFLSQFQEFYKFRQNQLGSGKLGDTYCIQGC